MEQKQMRVQWKMHNSNKDVSTEQNEIKQQIIITADFKKRSLYVFFKAQYISTCIDKK